MKYLVTVQQMATDPREGLDFVTTWSGAIDEDNLCKVKLNLVAELIKAAVKDAPASWRPMTIDEIRNWRDDPRECVTIQYGALG